MSSSVYYLTEVLENGSFHISIDNSLEKLEIFRGQGRLIISVVNYIMKLCSLDDKVIALLKCLDDSAWSCENDTTIEGNNCFSKLFMSFLQELREFFTVPKQQMSKITPAPNPNEFVGVFIHFLLQILEEILQLEPDFIVSVKGSIEVLRTELGFLVTYLGDTPSQSTEVEETKNVLTYIEAVVNEVGNCLYSFFFTRDDQVHVTGILDLALSDLLQKFELMKAKIKNHCITVSKMPTCMTPKTCVVSLFIVDSLLDDLQELINLNSDSTDDVSDQIRALHQELTLLRSSLRWDLPVLQNKEHEELVIQTRDIAYEIEYIINTFPPVWYLTVRLPQFMEKMKLIGLAIKDINNIAGIQEVEEYSSDQVSSQIKELSISEEIFVGFENEATEIGEKLVRGPQQLEIISIFGMPGLGKTTLAKKLYSDPSVFYHFDNRAWCVVSQTYQKRNMLIDILRTIGHHGFTNEDETLAEILYKSLSGRRYLVVLDDIWDINAWDDLSRYFPDNRTGSRIVFDKGAFTHLFWFTNMNN